MPPSLDGKEPTVCHKHVGCAGCHKPVRENATPTHVVVESIHSARREATPTLAVVESINHITTHLPYLIGLASHINPDKTLAFFLKKILSILLVK